MGTQPPGAACRGAVASGRPDAGRERASDCGLPASPGESWGLAPAGRAFSVRFPACHSLNVTGSPSAGRGFPFVVFQRVASVSCQSKLISPLGVGRERKQVF